MCPWLGEYLCSGIRQVLLLFRTKVPVVMPTISKVSLYFSFLPAKQRDFPGNVRSGGCDSLPLVVAFTSKQRDSLLSYALHFLHIISHQMCCAGERAECRAHQSVEKSLHLPEKKCKKSKSFRRGGYQAVKGSNKSALPTPKMKQKQKKNKESRQANSAFITAGAWAHKSLICCLF